MRGACSTDPCTITLAPSGGSGESQACWAHTTRSAGSRASAAPPVPGPSSSASVGTVSASMSWRLRAISPASPCSSASRDRAAPGVSITVTSGRSSSCARRIPRRAARSAPGPMGPSIACPRRSWPSTTQGILPNRASARSRPGSLSPSAVPCRITTSVAAERRRRRTPGRSSRRERPTESHTGASTTSGSASTGTGSPTPGRSHITDSARAVTEASASGGRTASTSPCACRFSATCTPAGNGSPYRASNTRGPRKPMRAPGSATVTWPSEPHEAKTPPVVGWRRYTR